MLYEDMQQRYGNHVAKRIQRELNGAEFQVIKIDELHHFLETRAEKLAQEYQCLMADPLARGNMRSETLQTKWQQAEDLAYLLSVAEDVASTVKANLSAQSH